METICPLVGKECVVKPKKDSPKGLDKDCIFFDRQEYEKGGMKYNTLIGYCILRRYVHDVLKPQMEKQIS